VTKSDLRYRVDQLEKSLEQERERFKQIVANHKRILHSYRQEIVKVKNEGNQAKVCLQIQKRMSESEGGLPLAVSLKVLA